MPRITPAARKALAEERRLQILRAAAHVFARKGFERATIADVARQARLAEGTIYNYFKNKDDLLACVPSLMILPAVQPLSAGAGGALAGAGSSDRGAAARSEGLAGVRGAPSVPPAQPALRSLAHNMVSAIRDNVDIMRIVLSALPSLSAPARRLYLKQTPLHALSILEKFIAAQIEAGVFRADLDPAITARTFPGMMLAFLLIQEVIETAGVKKFDYDQVVEHVLSIFLRGVLQPSAVEADSPKAPVSRRYAKPSGVRAARLSQKAEGARVARGSAEGEVSPASRRDGSRVARGAAEGEVLPASRRDGSRVARGSAEGEVLPANWRDGSRVARGSAEGQVPPASRPARKAPRRARKTT